MQMKEVPKNEVPDVSGGVSPARLPGGGVVVPEPVFPGYPVPVPGYPQIPTVPCFPDPLEGQLK
jgi:hypothetical protein